MKINKETIRQKGINYYNSPEIVYTPEELLNKIRYNYCVTIVSGERGVYEWFIYLDKHNIKINDKLIINFMVNKYFDQRDDQNDRHPNGGMVRSYEYHVYIKNIKNKH